MSTITEQDIKNLTPEHRIVWHEPPGQPVEMGLYVDGYEALRADTGHLVRSENGSVSAIVRSRIVRIIPPAFVPRVGMVIGHPRASYARLVRIGDEWLGYAPDSEFPGAHWFEDEEARGLIENHGWVVMESGNE